LFSKKPHGTKYNWQEKWEKSEIPFHLSIVNPLLEKYWPRLEIASTSNVFVPLCGKTTDLLWLANHGHHVIGVELSEIACETFFIGNKLSFDKKTNGNFTCYYNNQIELYCGDFFELSSDMFSPITAVYDRAAVIALPDELRDRYVNHLMEMMAPSSQILLIVYDSIDTVRGPPFPVSFREVQQLFGKQFQIHELACIQKTDLLKHLRDRGYKETYEVVYNLKG
jgi:thiopurine S-methyltransferase